MPVGQYADRPDANPQMGAGANTEQGDASPCGAHDMAGNVSEWTSSLFKPYPYRANDGREPEDSTEARVLRGGSWLHRPQYARAACRGHVDPGVTGDDYGFRLARTLPGS